MAVVYALTSGCVVIGTTLNLGIVFIPKVTIICHILVKKLRIKLLEYAFLALSSFNLYGG